MGRGSGNDKAMTGQRQAMSPRLSPRSLQGEELDTTERFNNFCSAYEKGNHPDLTDHLEGLPSDQRASLTDRINRYLKPGGAPGSSLTPEKPGVCLISHPDKPCEDRYFLSDNLAAVIDGMGGYQGGAEVAQGAVDKLSQIQNQPREEGWTMQAILQMREDLLTNREGKANACVTLAWQDGQRIEVAWCGDCRAYLIDASGELHLLTEDHSSWQKEIPNELVEDARLALDQCDSKQQAMELHGRHAAHAWQRRNSVSSALALGPIEMISGDLEPGDRVLICSDGVHDNLSQEQIQLCLAQEGDAAENLGRAAFEASSSSSGRAKPDDICCVVLSPEGVSTKGVHNEAVPKVNATDSASFAFEAGHHSFKRNTKPQPKKQAASSAGPPNNNGGGNNLDPEKAYEALRDKANDALRSRRLPDETHNHTGDNTWDPEKTDRASIN